MKMAAASLRNLCPGNRLVAILLLVGCSSVCLADSTTLFKRHSISMGTNIFPPSTGSFVDEQNFSDRYRYNIGYTYSFPKNYYASINAYLQLVPLSREYYPEVFLDVQYNNFRGIGLEAGRNYRLGKHFFMAWGVEGIFYRDNFRNPGGEGYNTYKNTKYVLLPQLRAGFVHKERFSLALDNAAGLAYSVSEYDPPHRTQAVVFYVNELLGLSLSYSFR